MVTRKMKEAGRQRRHISKTTEGISSYQRTSTGKEVHLLQLTGAVLKQLRCKHPQYTPVGPNPSRAIHVPRFSCD